MRWSLTPISKLEGPSSYLYEYNSTLCTGIPTIEDERGVVELDIVIWGISSVGRAPALQAGGHEFDPRIFHHSVLVQVG